MTTNTLGLHVFAIAPSWDAGRLAPRMERLAALGVGLLEIPLLRPEEIDVPATRALCERHGMEVVASLGLPERLDSLARPDEALDFLRGVMTTAAAMGAGAVSGVTYATIGRTTGQGPTEAERDGLARFIERAAREAAAHGLRLGIEPCNRYETHLMNRGEDAAGVCERVGADNLFVHLDTYHMAIEERSFADGVRAAGPHLGYVHLSEANRGVPGRGTVDWAAAMEALAAVGYEGPMTLESMNHMDPDIARGLAVWRPVAERPEDVIEEGLPFLREAARRAGIALGRSLSS